MDMEAELSNISEELEFLKEKLESIEKQVQKLREPEVRPEYLEKLKKIEKEKGRVFNSVKELDDYLQNEI